MDSRGDFDKVVLGASANSEKWRLCFSLHAGASLLHASSIRIPCGCVTMRANGEFSSDCNILREMASGVAFTLTGMVSTSQSVTSDW